MITYGSTTLTSYNSIVKTEVYYYKSTSATSLSGGSWSTTKPTWENGKYIWQKIRTVYEDGTHSESDPVNITGQQGATGTAAYSYKLNSSDSIIGKTKDGEYTIKKITFSATSKQGSGAVSAYSGRFKIESTTNGSTWKTEYTSSGNESSKEFTIPNNIIAIKCSLYQSGGTTVLLDIVTVPVVKDGVDAIGLRDSIPYYLASNKDTGITRLTQGWTRYRPQLTAEKKYLWVYYVSRYSEGTTEPELIEIKDDLVHFENNGDESPVESCVVDIEPVQDLHGYDSPWPAGGNVNKITVNRLEGLLDNYNPDTKRTFEYDKYYIGLSFNNYYNKSLITEYSVGNNTVSLKTTRNAYGIAFPVAVTPNTEYFIGATYNGTSRIAVSFFDVDGGLISYSTLPVGESKAITTPNECVTCVLVVYDNAASGQTVGVTDVFFNSPSSETSYTPYSNICPITGWTGCEIWDDSKYGKTIWWNQLAEYPIFASPFTVNGITWTKNNDNSVTVVGTVAGYTNSYIQITDNKEAVVGHKYYIYSGSESGKVLIWYNGAGGIGPSVRNIGTITSIANGFYLRVNGEGTTVNETVKPQIFDLTEMFGVGNEPSTIEEFRALFPKGYYPYNEGEQTCVSAVNGDIYKHISITFPSEAGTVYGGTLDVTTGELVVDRAMVVIDGVNKTVRENGITSMTSNAWFSSAVGKAYGRNNFISDRFATGIGIAPGGMSGRDNSIGVEFLLPTDIPNNSTALNQWFADNPTQLCYELAEPVTYHLAPQEITMLCKENNIFADTGQTAISYYDNQTSTDPYVDYSLTSAFDASTIEPAYIETEWVESTGKQYVYLDWKPPIKTWGFEIDFISYNALGTSVGAWNEDTNKNGYGTIFGVRNYSGVNNAQLSSYSNGLLRIGNGTNQATGFKTNHTRQQIKLQNTTITKTDGTTSTVSRLDETANKPYCNMTVFGLHEGLRRAGNGGISEPSSTRIYSLKFYDGDTLTVDLVGAIRKRDSVTGLYDKVSKHFYPAPGMLFGDVVGDIGDSISMKEAMDKANPQTIVVNKDRTRMWEATVPFNDLQDGQKITVTYSYGNIVSSVETGELIGWDDTSNNQQVYLKLTFADGHKTDWIPCYYSNTGRLTTHYGAGIPIQLTYRENILANASETASGNMVLRGFFADANYDSNNTDIVRWSYGRVIAGSNKIFPYSIIMQNADERWESIVTSSTTAKTKTRNTHGFRLDTILYQAANTTTNENAENTSYQLRTGDPIMDMRYNLNIEDTNELRLVHGKSVYLVGTVGADGLFYLADQWWSQSLPTTEDGKIYIFLGQVYDWYRCGLATMHPIYKFVDGKLKSTLQIAVDALDKAKEVAQDLADLGADLQAQIDGKIETWCQSTDPSTAWTTTELKNQHNGDLWYYTGESTSNYKNNTTYKYTASTNKWTAYSASTDLFDKIDAKTSIYYGKPSAVTQNLEVGDYLVDSTDGCSYRWDGSKWVKLTDYQAAIDKIEVGGRNLLKWTTKPKANGTYYKKDPEETDGWYAWNSSVGAITETDNGIKFTHNSSTTMAGIVIPLVSLNAVIGETEYVLSFKYRTNLISIGTPYLLCQTDGNISYGQTISIIQSETDWKYFNQKIQWSSSSGRNTWAILVPYINISNGWIEIQNGSMKLEKGNRSTDWTPAPEDTEAEISALQEDLQSQIDEKIQTYYQSTNPASAWTTADIRATHDGDLWCYTGTTTSTYTKDNVYRYNASNNTWTTYSASGDLFDKVDGKTTVFYGKTTDTFTDVEIGDYLVDATDGSSYRYDGSKWVKVTDYQTTITNAIDNIQIGGRNLALDSSLTGNIQKWNPTVNRWTKTIKDGHECLMCEGSLNTTATLTVPLTINSESYGVVPYNGLQLVFSADVLLEDVVKGTTNFYLALYGSGQTIDGTWRGVTSVKNSPYMIGSSIIPNELNGIGWTRVWYIFKYDDYNWSAYLRPTFYARDFTGKVYVKNIKVEYGDYATDWTPAPEDVTSSIQTYVDTLQFQVDHMAEIYYGTAVPTLSNTPASDWNTNDIKDIHVDDLYYNTSTGYCYRFTKSGSTYSWTRIKDSDITAAATAASNANTAAGNAQTTANNANTLAGQKRRIFVAQPTPPYEVGDLWVEGSNGDIKKCKTARATGSYAVSDWELASKYTDDTLANEANDKIDNLEIGGRNYKQNSNFSNKLNKWSSWNGATVTIDKNIENKNWAHVTMGANKAYGGFSWELGKKTNADPMPIISGNEITIAFDAQLIEGEGNAIIWLHYRSTEVGTNLVQAVQRFSLTETTSRFSHTFVIPSHSTNTIDTICVMIGIVDGTIKQARFTNIKVEKGNRATDWSPAPEDVDASIATAQSTADTAMDRATAIYGTCSTDSIVDAKVVVCPDFVLFDGVRIQVAFENANSTTVPSINVNNTGAKQILINQATVSESNQLLWAENAQLEFVYDGTYWVLQNAPYSLYGICSVTEEIPAKVIECAEAVICKGTTITVDFMYSNTSDNTVFNVANIAQKPLLVNGDTLKVNSRFNWHAGAVRTFYFDGQAWNMSDDIVSAYIDEYETEQDEDGIMVHPVGQKNTGWSIGSTLEMLKNGVSYIKMWFDKVEEGEFSLPFIRIGKESGNHVLVGDDAVTIREDQKELAHYSSLGITFDDETPYKIGNDTTYIAFEDTDNDAKADSLRIVADSISFHSNGTEKDLRTELESLTENVDLNTQAIEQNSEIIENTQRYIQINPEVPSIKLATNDRNYLLIESNKLGFWVDANETAYMSQNQMNIPTASITNLLMQTTNAETGETIGQIGWVMRTNGHLSLKIMN